MLSKVVSSFLSHLCGDEEALDYLSKCYQFLSHLCGDEVFIDSSVISQYFLSHLCGDEASESVDFLI